MRSAANAIQTLRDLVDRNARLHGELVHQVFGDRRHTFRQYRARSLALAGAVYDLGLRAQDRLSILAMNDLPRLPSGKVSKVLLREKFR